MRKSLIDKLMIIFSAKENNIVLTLTYLSIILSATNLLKNLPLIESFTPDIT